MYNRKNTNSVCESKDSMTSLGWHSEGASEDLHLPCPPCATCRIPGIRLAGTLVRSCLQQELYRKNQSTQSYLICHITMFSFTDGELMFYFLSV